jgi:ATP sulfurylase
MDIREATFMDFREKFSQFMDFVKEIKQFRNLNRKCAFITKNPEHVAYSEIVRFKLKAADVIVDIEIFSTEEAALNWIMT